MNVATDNLVILFIQIHPSRIFELNNPQSILAARNVSFVLILCQQVLRFHFKTFSYEFHIIFSRPRRYSFLRFQILHRVNGALILLSTTFEQVDNFCVYE